MLYCTGFFFIVIFFFISFFFFCFFFFFSSRRRHTRCSRDWSSDVCSSDLVVPALAVLPRRVLVRVLRQDRRGVPREPVRRDARRLSAGRACGVRRSEVDRKSVV